MKQILAKGFAKKDTKAFRPDKETGKWRGAETQNGNFATIKPGWTAEFKINNKKHILELWAFNNKWGAQSMFYKLKKVKEEDNLEDTM